MSTVSETLEFENARVLHQTHAEDPALLRLVEEGLGVKLTARDGWLRIEGGEGEVTRGVALFQQLEAVRGADGSVSAHDFRQALRALIEDGQDDLGVLHCASIHLGSKRAPIRPRNRAQRLYTESIRKHDVVFGIGPAGTGKTYLAMAMAVEALRADRVTRIILTRPAVEAGEALGFLPGDLHEKIFPYLRPLYDALYDMMDAAEVQRYIEEGVIEIAPLAYMRGRTLNHAFIILDEAQNTTSEQMFMFLTRMGTDSKCVVTGDPTQVDLPPSKTSGLIEALRFLKGVPGLDFLHFSERDVIRHELVQAIIRAYRRHREGSADDSRTGGSAPRLTTIPKQS